MQTQQSERGARFRALHQREQPFLIPNPWDVGSARLLASFGFEALATTSAGQAAACGVVDGALTRDEVVTHITQLVAATDLPLSADLEHGFGDDPNTVAASITAAAQAGAVGASIEDLGRRTAGGELYPIALATERIAAATEAARALPFEFVLTARCERFLTDRPDLADTIRRLQAYQAAGADVLYAPGVVTAEQIRSLVTSVDRPLNVVMGLSATSLSLEQLGALGVRRVSVGSALARAAYGAFIRAAEELRDRGTFEFAEAAVPYARLTQLLSRASHHARSRP